MDCFPAASFPKSFPISPAALCGARRALAPRRSASQAASGSPGGLEVVFLPSPSLHDGRFANDGWLQELPDPLTKLTWDNPALVSPKTAETLGLASGDLVRLDYAGRSLELPVWLLPGMADGVVALTLGYGRSHAGRIGSGVGFDAFTVRASQAPGFDSGVKLTRARAHLPALGDPGARQHGGAPRRARVDPDRASIEIRLRQGFGGQVGRRAEHAEGAHAGAPASPEGRAPAHSASSRRNRITSPSGRSMPTIRGTSGA